VVCTIPWDETDQFIRSGHRSGDNFEKDSFRTITISEEEGIKAVIGKPKGKDTTEVQSYLFDKSKGWTVDKAKAWFEQHKDQERVKLHEHVSAILPFKVLEKIVDKPLKIRGVAMTAGMSRNFNIYTSEELQSFASKLVSAPVYIEHVAVPNACGKVTKTGWDGENLWYEAEIFEGDVADKIRKGLIQHVSVGADYETLDMVDGQVPHGLHNAELSLVAVPGIPEANLQIFESLQRAKEQQEFCVFCGKNAVEFWLGCCSECFENLPIAEVKRKELLERRKKMREQQGFEPIVAGEYYLGFVQDPTLFMPEHFRTVWIDQPNGVLALMAKAREDPTRELCQAVLFLKSKWQPNTVQDWLTIHPDYMLPASASASQSTPIGSEKLEKEKLSDLESRFEKFVNARLAECVEGSIKAFREAREKAVSKEQQGSQEPPKAGEPKTDKQRFMDHFGIDEEVFQKLYDVLGDELFKLLPERGQKVKEAEWTTEYINDLPDSSFAVIGAGGEKDEQGKTMPRTLRHLPHHNVDGGLDLPHLRNALARMNQIEPASLRAEAKRHLCAHAKESDIVSEFCGEEPPSTQEKSPCEKAKESLAERVKVLEAQVAELKAKQDLNAVSGLVKNPPKTVPIEEAIKILEELLPSPAVERSTMGMQRECQAIRSEVLKLRERLKSG